MTPLCLHDVNHITRTINSNMGAIGSKSKSKRENNSEVSKYGKLNEDCDENVCFIPVTKDNKSKDHRQQINGIPVPKTDINGCDSVNHRDRCTIQMSPISTTSADDDDTWSSSTHSFNTYLDNSLLKRADVENPLFLPADGRHSHRSIRPVNPCKLGIATEQVGLELEENGIIKYEHWDNCTSCIDPKEEGIIGELRSVGIISHGTTGIDGNLKGDSKRRLPPRLVHLPVEPTLPQKIVADVLLPNVKYKVVHEPATSKSDVGTEFLKQARPAKHPQKEESEILERTLSLL